MLRVPGLLIAALLLLGCPARQPAGSTDAARARALLAERERKITAYRFRAQTSDASGVRSYGFVLRRPNAMRLEVDAPRPRVLTFDGRQLLELDPETHTLTDFDLDGGSAADLARVRSLFMAFVPEGFGPPMLPTGDALRAVDGGPAELHLVADLPDGELGQIPFTLEYRYASPAMDLLEKRVRTADGDTRVQVLQQRCDAASGLCFPLELQETFDGRPRTHTVLSEVEINGPAGDAEFTQALPPGGALRHRPLAEAR